MEKVHISVLLGEVLFFLHGRHLRFVYDGTCGGGGHSKAILEAHPEIERFIAGDVDPYARERARVVLESFNVEFYDRNFSEPPDGEFDAILLDIGVSSFQLDMSERGFGFSQEGPLDMRMNPQQGESAADIVNGASKEELAKIFWEYGEERHSRRIAEKIVSRRKSHPFYTTQDLVDCILSCIPRRGKIHPATRVFQALRIAVNHELTALQIAIPKLAERLTAGGRLLIITFHSLEDRIVKQEFKALAKEEGFLLVTKKPVAPSLDECRKNRRARSAKLRVLERV